MNAKSSYGTSRPQPIRLKRWWLMTHGAAELARCCEVGLNAFDHAENCDSISLQTLMGPRV